MKIAVNTRLLIQDKMDGIGRFTYETIFRLAVNHPEHEFTLIFDRKDHAKLHFPENVSTSWLNPPARHPILWYIWFEMRLAPFINRQAFDLFLSPEGWVPPKVNCPSLAVVHDLNFLHQPENIIFSHRKYLQYFFPRFVKRADRIATVSEFSKTDLTQSLPVPPEKIDVVYNGVNKVFKPISPATATLIRKKYSEGWPYFIFIGTLHPRKNLEHLFEAFDLFRRQTSQNMKLLVAGNRKWWPSSLSSRLEGLQYNKDIVFLGRVDDLELAKILAGATALTYLPYFEGFGIPILEAFQSQVPVITSDVTSMPEVAAGAAMLCAPRNVTEIADAMQQVATNERVREDLIEKGLKRAKEFSWDRTAELVWESILKIAPHEA
jgi:glycosyltransferase involved in cell wall biosynthesis